MTEESYPVTIAGNEYQLRYYYPDFKKMEFDLGTDYVNFINQTMLYSLNGMEVYLWRGIKKQNDSGVWVHVFPQDQNGRDAVGVILWQHFQNPDNSDHTSIPRAIFEAFCVSGPFHKVKKENPVSEPKGDDTKNLTT